MLKHDYAALMQKYFKPITYNLGELEMIFSYVDELTLTELEFIIKSIVESETHVGVIGFKARAQSYLKQSNVSPTYETISMCSKCLDTGVVFVKAEHSQVESLAMQCDCNCRNDWGLPIYSSKYTIVNHPYLKIKNKGSWDLWCKTYARHMHKSKEIWNTETKSAQQGE